MMTNTFRSTLVLGLLIFATTGAFAAPPKPPRAEIVDRLFECSAIADDTERLGCFDQRVAALDSAARSDEVVVLDKSELQKARRTLFGFSFPQLPFLKGSDKETEGGDDIAQIEAEIESVRSLGMGKWQIRLTDGAEWTTIEAIAFPEPRPGMKIEIKRAALGSFRGRIERSAPIRMKRSS